MRQILIAAGVGLAVTLLGTPLAIRLFRVWGWGQRIREDGPHTHLEKMGTPTMGGTVMILAIVAGYVVTRLVFTTVTAAGMSVLLAMVLLGILGFVDDYIKVRRRRSLGLSKTAKIAGQAIIAIAFTYVAVHFAGVPTELSFIRDTGLDLGVFFVVWVFVILASSSNAVNLTDGLDGLASGSSILVLSAYVFIAFWQFRHTCALGPPEACYPIDVNAALDIAIVAGAAVGAAAGFLWWNAAPARIFMGDTGAMALGGLMGALAIMTSTQLLLVVLGGLFVIETTSVIVQVIAFRGFGRRVFRMSPIHHHFELAGWPEFTVIVRFWILTGLSVAVGIGLFYTDFVARGDRVSGAFEGVRAVVVGLGVAGASAARVLLAEGAQVLVTESRSGDPAATELRAEGIDVVDGGHAPQHLDGATLVLASPGVAPDAPVLRWAREQDLPIWGELELGARLARVPYIAVTGTNGKTTTTGMIASCLREAGVDVVACGNIGRPFATTAREAHDVLVVEASSFQLALQESFHPRVSVLLNVAPDHLDWHGSFEAYAEAKRGVFAGQGADDVHVGNLDDGVASAISATATCELVWFTLGEPRPGGTGFLDARLTGAWSPDEDLGTVALDTPAIRADAAACAAACHAFGVEGAAIVAGLAAFELEPHRGQSVATVEGVRFVDDSKATNPHAAIASVGEHEHVVLIAGGDAKGVDLSPLGVLAPRLAAVVAIGAAAPEVVALFDERVPTGTADSIEEAVGTAFGLAPVGGTVLLAPACASWDMFADYAERGERFAAAARALADRLRPVPTTKEIGP